MINKNISNHPPFGGSEGGLAEGGLFYILADDITGAAEIAGIAHSYGLRTVLTLPSDDYTAVRDADCLVIATDARSYGADEAARMTAAALRAVPYNDARDIIFRKTDSALRGNVREELAAIEQTLADMPGAQPRTFVYMPANPSKGRIIRDGIYYINDVRIQDTDFSFDPEFPAWSSSVAERFPGLEYADAVSKQDVDRVVSRALAEGKLLAGAADLFCSLLEAKGYSPRQDIKPTVLSAEATKVIVRGSTQSKNIDLGLPVESMPLDVFYEEKSPMEWAENLIERQHRRQGGVILTIGDKEVRQGKSAAVYLRNAIATACCALIADRCPDELIIEGGATAYAIMSQLPYKAFTVTDQFAPGVVRLEAMPTAEASAKVCVTLKPGSYPWGGLFV